jgi:translation initiation factor IF-2
MSDGNDTNKTGGGERRPLTLKKTEGAGTVRQSFSHGRTKTVVVETKKKKVLGAPGGGPAPTGAGPAVAPPSGPRPTGPAPQAPAAPASSASFSTPVTRASTGTLGLSPEELKARQSALARARQEDERRESERRVQEEARRRQDEERRRLDEERRREEEASEARRRAEEEADRRARESAERAAGRAGDQIAAAASGAGPTVEESAEAPVGAASSDLLEQLGGRVKKQRGPAPKLTPISRTKGEAQRRQGRLTVVSALADDESERSRSLAAMRRAREKEKERRMRGVTGNTDKVVREVVVPEAITVQELANRMAERVADVVKYLMRQGQMMRAIDTLDADTAQLIVEDFGHSVRRVAESDVEIGLEGVADTDENVKPRPPIVTVMGHVDHGKTSLLDALRQTDVAAGEAGGITQHIGAYQVRLADGERITFLDTPGHAAFSAMRARGASVTDIVILVVAADDGVMPQTIEAIRHAKSANVPIIVAVNKIDRPDANPERVLTDLLQHEVVVEKFGGEVQAVEVSALKKLGLDALTDAIVLQAELLQLRANPDRDAEGAVIEAKLDKGRGPVASVLVRRGTLKRGDIVVAGAQWGRVRALSNERGQTVQSAGPAEPVEILGLEGVPEPGDVFVVVDTDARAREIVDYRQRVKRERQAVPSGARASLEQMMARLKTDDVRELPIILKADVQGSVEAITAAVEKISQSEVRARVILGGVGGVTESDITLAKSTGAPVVAFNVRANAQARDLAEREGVEIRYYSIIYELLDDLRDTLQGMLKPIVREKFIGYATILEVFNISKVGKVAGCRVTDGNVKRGAGVRLLRDNVVIHEGKLGTLKRFKDEVQEVVAGQECGMGFENYQDIRPGDQIECFETEVLQRTLETTR